MFLAFVTFLQTELPKPKPSTPSERWGLYSFQDFLAANWYYLVVVLILVVIFSLYVRNQQKKRRKFMEEKQKKTNASSTSR